MRGSLLTLLLLAPAIAFAQAEVDDVEVAQAEVDAPDVAAQGDGSEAARSRAHVRPPASPTVVEVGVFLHALTHVDPPSESFPHFRAHLLLSARWRDPRLAFDEEAEGSQRRVFQEDEAAARLRQIWHPDLAFENEDGERQVDGLTMAIRADGTVIYEELLTSRFRARMRLARFPFDTQRFHLALQSVTWNANKVALRIVDDKTGFHGGRQRGSLEWEVTGMESEVLRADAARSSHPYSRAVYFVRAERRAGFYLWKLIVPLLLIVAVTWTAFWMTGEGAGTRMQRTFIALLSVVAFHHVISDHLPRIPQMTFMDATVYLAFAFTGFAMVQIVATHRAARAGDEARAEKLDRVSRWAFPLAFGLGIGALFVYYAFLA